MTRITRPPLALAVAAICAIAPAPTAYAQGTSAEDQYVDTGPTNGGTETIFGAPGTDQGGPPGSVAGSPGSSPASSATSSNVSSADQTGGHPAGKGSSASANPAGGSSPEPAAAGDSSGGTVPILDYPATPLIWAALGALVLALGYAAISRFARAASTRET